ncbi:BTAD domain-containing putative transcriptional regulator, partial [Embleya sp. AB8]|uniref:AfsR/SARP family transcriptional regulator n=1 Tax=Embleya sp. AB8 TaxID=3156304 RepID=UPI003C78D9E3
MVYLRVLGPFEADVADVTVPLGGPRQRAVLALLVAARGRVVSIDRMIEDLWRGEPPAQAITSLQAYVSNLRRLLEPGRPRRAPATILVSAAPGYALRLPDDAVDAWRFEHLLRTAHDRADTAPAEAHRLAEDALALWHGPAFAAAADEPWAYAEATRLDELHLSARELHIATALRSGATAAATVDAERLTRDAPLREEAWRLHALALWSGNRQADALATLRQARAVLAADVGLDPGPALTDLEQAILSRRMEVLREATEPPPGPPTRPARPTDASSTPEPQVATTGPAQAAPEPPTGVGYGAGTAGPHALATGPAQAAPERPSGEGSGTAGPQAAPTAYGHEAQAAPTPADHPPPPARVGAASATGRPARATNEPAGTPSTARAPAPGNGGPTTFGSGEDRAGPGVASGPVAVVGGHAAGDSVVVAGSAWGGGARGGAEADVVPVGRPLTGSGQDRAGRGVASGPVAVVGGHAAGDSVVVAGSAWGGGARG